MFKKSYRTKGCRRFLALLLAGVLTVSGMDMLTVSASEAPEAVSEALQSDDNQVVDDATKQDDSKQEGTEDESTESNPVTETVTAPETEPTVEPAAAPETEPTVEPAAAPETEPTVEPTAAPETEPGTAESDVKVEIPVLGGALPVEGMAASLDAGVSLMNQNAGISLMSLDAGIMTVEEEGEYVLDAASLTAFGQGSKSDGDTEEAGTQKGTKGYFTLIYSAKTKVDASNKTFDGYSGTQRINFGGTANKTKNAIKFTTSAAAKVKVYWVSGGTDRFIAILNDSGSEVASTNTSLTANATAVDEFSLSDAGTYYLGNKGNNNYIFKVVVKEETGPAVDVSVTPTITGLADNQTLFLVRSGTETQITANAAVTLTTGKYDLLVKTDGIADSDVRATVGGATSVTIEQDTTQISVNVSSAYVNPTVKLAEGSTLADGNSITLKAASDSSTIPLTVGSAAKLTIGETYALETASGSKTKALVGGKTEFTAAEGMKSLEITVEATVVNVPVKIIATDASLISQITALTLTGTSSFDLLEASNHNSNIELNVGEEYTLSCTGLGSDDTYAVNSENSTKVEITPATDRITVVLTKKVDGLNIVDLTNGLMEGQSYPGGISVMYDMPYTASSGTVQAKDKKRAELGGNNDNANPAINFPTSSAKATGAKGDVPVYGAVLVLNAEKDGRLKIGLKSSGKITDFVDADEGLKDSFTCSADVLKTYQVQAGHTYYFYAEGSKIKMYSIVVDYRTAADWASVDAPTLGTPVASRPGSAKEGTISIPYNAMIGGIYSDSMDIRVMQNGAVIDVITVAAETSIANDYQGIAEYTPAASGDYTFTAILKRSGEQGKASNEAAVSGFVLPMAKPIIVNTEELGSGSVRFSWQEVAEATSYNVYLDGTLAGSTDKPYYRFTGLSGKKYTFAVEAVGNGDVSEKSSQEMTVTGQAKKNWKFAAFGQGVSSKSDECGSRGSLETGDLSLWDVKNKGKLVPASTDGLSFYYTTIDPETENFTLTADVVVNSWEYTNGQEGFGLMAADRVGVHGDSSVFWNNSYMLSVTKVEYTWDPLLGAVSDSGSRKYTMRLGVGAQEKIGVTPENLSGMEDGSAIAEFKTNMYTLETSAATTIVNEDTGEYLPAGASYNIVGNHQEKFEYPTTSAGEQTTFHMVLQRNNTGYFLSYTDQNGVTTTKKFYHGDEGDELARLDSNNIYVGFFASRTANISIQNATLTTIAPEDDAPAEERPISYITPKVGFESAKISNSADYELVYYGNVDGMLSIKMGEEQLIDQMPVKADTKYRFDTTLDGRINEFSGYVKPDDDFAPSKYERLSDYSGIDFNIVVDYNVSNRNIYYVSPDAIASGDGSKYDPIDIYSAVRGAKPGDRILLKEGTYSLSQTVTIERGIDGTPDAKIYMMADPEAASRPVLDFNKACAGMIMAGDYWYFQGFDVTRSSAGDKGIQVSGSYNTLDNLRTYRNGNTGVQISRFKGTDLWEDWPSHNLILNCTSYLNADPGYEDADGFAAKLTIADGNVFDGCIAAYNADDGWDLFAKIESGPIGRVEIRNSVAFKNGYDIGENGEEIVAGNGNGFKMGGSSITGYHTLRNSVAFANRAKGIDSNSCPDIQVYNSISFNNQSYNVAFYTNDAKNTDFLADGIISYKTAEAGSSAYNTGENFKLLGTQDESKVRGKTNYYWAAGKSTNTNKETVADDWFVNMDMDAAIHGGICRNADGTINMNGFLVLTDAAPANAGARLEEAGTASEEIVMPELVESFGNGSSGGGAAVGGAAAELIVEVDWKVVASNIDAANKSKTPQNISVLSGDRFEVPVNVLSKLAGKNATIALQAGGGITFTISGKDVKKATVPFKMTLSHADVIPANVANQVLANAQTSRIFSMEEKTAYPYLVNVHVNLGAENAGKTAYLYYYDEKSNSMKLSGSFRITGTGQAMFAIHRGDEYIITVAGKPAALSGKYIVVSGDTLSYIAKKAGTSLKKLVEANPQIKNVNMIHPGQELNLP